MSALYSKVVKRIRMTKDAFRADCHFSPRYGALRVADELGGRLGMNKLSRWAHEKKDQWILDYLEHLLQPVLNTYYGDESWGERQSCPPIWTCWWSGEETAPPLVRRCVDSIRTQAGEHPVHLITKDNYQRYLDIPGYMLEKVDRKQMGLAHLADYIRVKLLAQYGGLWLDATIFCAAPIPEECFALPVFSFKSQEEKGKYISAYRWATFGFGGWQGSVFYRYLTAAFEQYWSSCDRAIDYLFFDYIIHLGVEKIPAIRALIDQIPMNNLRRDDLQAAMNAALPAEKFYQVIQPDTSLYKLSWREAYRERTEDGQPTVYKYFLYSEGEQKYDT